MTTKRAHSRLVFDAGRAVEGLRDLPEEVAVALTYNGSTRAVMMATPDDLVDFAYGFSLTEGIARPEEIEDITVVPTDLGVDVQIWLTPAAAAREGTRRRTMTGPVGCGLCGIDSLKEAVRSPAVINDQSFTMTPKAVMAAMESLRNHQPLHDATHAAHAAGFWTPQAPGLTVREDVGRHNALDKLIGALRGDCQGAVILTCRTSIDMVQKAAAAGFPILIAASAPTSAAVSTAQAAGITLIALARSDRFEVFTHPARISAEEATHVA
jgi:FdhD protein